MHNPLPIADWQEALSAASGLYVALYELHSTTDNHNFVDDLDH